MPVPKAEVLELMRKDPDQAEFTEIRELWKEHSKAEDNRSIEGLLATLSEDCVYTVYPDESPGTGTRVRRASTPSC